MQNDILKHAMPYFIIIILYLIQYSTTTGINIILYNHGLYCDILVDTVLYPDGG